MTLTKWNADLIDGLDELDGGVDGDYLPLEGGTLTGELTVDANLILEGSITKGDCVLKKHSDGDIEKLRTNDTATGTTIEHFPEKQYILSPSQGTMQHLTVDCSTRFLLESDQVPQSQSDQDYFFEDGQSMSLRLEVHDLDTFLEDRYKFIHTWPEDIWWVNTEEGLAPDLDETGAITVNLWKAKGVLYGQLVGDFVKQPEYHKNAFNIKKLKWEINSLQHIRPSEGGGAGQRQGPKECRIYGPDPKLKGSEYDWPLFVHEPQPQGDPDYGITQRGGVTFTRTSRDGRYHFLGQTGSEDNPSELRTFTNSLPSETIDTIKWEYDSPDGAGTGLRSGIPTPMEIPHRFHCGGREDDKGRRNYLEYMYTDQPKLLGTAVDMRLRVEKGSGIDFNPDGTRMFQSVSNYLDPSLKDKYENVIGAHHLADPWDVGTTDFFQQEKLNDIIYCDEKYSEVRALHPDMRVCCLTFRPDGMGFYFAYVVYEDSSKNLQYYFVQQDLTVPWELSSAKEEYKYSKLFEHIKYEDRLNVEGARPPITLSAILKTWHINCITVSNNGKYLHVALPHAYYNPHQFLFSDKPRQFEMTTPWDISTSDLSWIGVGPALSALSDRQITKFSQPTDTNGAFAGHYLEALSHGIHWNSSGTKCYVSFVPETNNGKPGQITGTGSEAPMFKNCHYFNQKAWEIDYDL